LFYSFCCNCAPDCLGWDVWVAKAANSLSKLPHIEQPRLFSVVLSAQSYHTPPRYVCADPAGTNASRHGPAFSGSTGGERSVRTTHGGGASDAEHGGAAQRA